VLASVSKSYIGVERSSVRQYDGRKLACAPSNNNERALQREERTAVAIAQRVLQEPFVGSLPVNGLVEVSCHATICARRRRVKPGAPQGSTFSAREGGGAGRTRRSVSEQLSILQYQVRESCGAEAVDAIDLGLNLCSHSGRTIAKRPERMSVRAISNA